VKRYLLSALTLSLLSGFAAAGEAAGDAAPAGAKARTLVSGIAI